MMLSISPSNSLQLPIRTLQFHHDLRMRPSLLSLRRINKTEFSTQQRRGCVVFASSMRPTPEYSYDSTNPNSIFLDLLQNIFRDVQSGFLFLLEQPKELKNLEFPSLQSAGRMALFTIVVVMVLIVILATVDFGLSYIMARLFSRVP